MAIDKAVDSAALDAGLTSIADAIRAKSGTSAQLDFPNGFSAAVKAIETRKPEQAKTVAVTQNGITTVIPDGGKVLSSVTVNVNVGDDTAIEDALVARTIKSYTNDRVTTIGSYAFCRCNELVNAAFLNVKSIGYSAFNGCNKLTEITLPKVESLDNGAFASCGIIRKFEFPSIVSINPLAFQNCAQLRTLAIKTQSKVCILADRSAFNRTPIAEGTGFIYVPDNLVEQYKVATNWALYADQIKPLSELEEVLA